MTFENNVLATGGGTTIPITSLTTDQVRSGPAAEWSSFAARYQQFRVRAIRIKGYTTQPVQTATVTHGVLFRADYLGTAVPSTAVQVFSDEACRTGATYKDFVDIVTWKLNPNAELWNPTSAAIPAANQFAWVCASATTPALTTGTTYFAYTVEWEVEFRGSQ